MEERLALIGYCAPYHYTISLNDGQTGTHISLASKGANSLSSLDDPRSLNSSWI